MTRSRVLKVVLYGSVGLMAITSVATAQARDINIPAGNLKMALDRYIRQSGVQLVYTVRDVDGQRSHAVEGRYEPISALDRLLEGTQLVANRDPSGAVIVSKRLSAGPDIEPAGPAPSESIVVTGSRIISDIANSPTPLTVVSAEQLQATTPTNIADGLAKLPVFMGSRGQRTVQNASSNNNGNVLNLRNFGVERTLVLLDGHRVAPSNSDGTVDIDVLPMMLMSRVDVVTGGASAVYGSDAVTGVVNFVLDKKVDGFKYDVNAGISKYGDAAEYQFGAAWGTQLFGGRGHLEAAVRYFNQDMVPINARPYGFGESTWAGAGAGTASNPFVTIPNGRLITFVKTGTISCGSTCAANNKTFVSQGVIGPYNPGIPTGTTNLYSGGDGGYNAFGTFSSKLRTAESFARFSYDIDDTTNFYVQATASESGNWANWLGVIISPNAGRPNKFFNTNPYLSPSAQALLANAPGGVFSDPSNVLLNIDGVSARDSNRLNASASIDRNLGVTAGVDGKFGKFDWDLYYTHGESRQKEYNPKNTDNGKLMATMDAVLNSAGQSVCYVSTVPAYAALYPGCQPGNYFGPSGPSAAAFDYFSQKTQFIQTNILDDVGGSISGTLFDLPAGPVKAALSGEMRWAKYDVVSNASPTQTVDCTGLRLCTPGATFQWVQNVVANASAANNVYEFGGEVNLPLLKNLPLIQDLSANIAGRYTNYSTSGAAETWKLGLDYHVNDTIRFRGTMSVDIRAPNLNDLSQPLQVSSTGFLDLLTNVSASTLLRTQGNSNLKPEVAHTYTTGIVLTPTFIPGLTMSVDYWKINMSSAITSLSYNNTAVQNLCMSSGGTSPYCSLVSRPLGLSNTTPANYPNYIIAQKLNSAKVRTEGLDFETDYAFDMADVFDWMHGSVSFRNLLSIQPYIDTISIPGTAPAFTVMPKGRMTTFLSYNVGNWGINLQNTWLSGFSKLSAAGQVYAQPRINSFDTLDVTVDRKFAVDGNDMDVYFSIQNIGNTQPPLFQTNSSNPGLFYSASPFENGMGRYFTIGVRGNL